MTVAGNSPTYAEAVVIDEGKIVFVGAEAEAMQLKVPAIEPHSHFIDSLAMASHSHHDW